LSIGIRLGGSTKTAPPATGAIQGKTGGVRERGPTFHKAELSD
jgi:hypothetical protein